MSCTLVPVVEFITFCHKRCSVESVLVPLEMKLNLPFPAVLPDIPDRPATRFIRGCSFPQLGDSAKFKTLDNFVKFFPGTVEGCDMSDGCQTSEQILIDAAFEHLASIDDRVVQLSYDSDVGGALGVPAGLCIVRRVMRCTVTE